MAQPGGLRVTLSDAMRARDVSREDGAATEEPAADASENPEQGGQGRRGRQDAPERQAAPAEPERRKRRKPRGRYRSG